MTEEPLRIGVLGAALSRVLLDRLGANAEVDWPRWVAAATKA